MFPRSSFGSVKADVARVTGVAGIIGAAELSAAPGAYLILLRLDTPLPLDIATLGPATLTPGCYVYAGSARGPGGLRARVARHLRRDKLRHWHIDHLSEAASEMRAFAVPGGRECALIDALLATKRYTAPVPGFGSSDCRTCTSHLLFHNEP